jgi:DNA-binding LytR/AlgR family response regulator
VQAPARAEYLSGHRRGHIVPLHIDDIALVEVQDTIPFAHVQDGRFALRMPMHEVELALAPPAFFRVSRSSIVALDAVASLVPGESGTYTAVLRVPAGHEVSVSRRRARLLKKALRDSTP